MGCNRYLIFNVDSIASGEEMKNNFVILPGIENIDPNSLQFQEYANYIKRALEQFGYKFVKDPKKANGVIFLSYGIGNPKTKTYTYSVPVWGQTGYSSSYTTGNVYSYGNWANVNIHTTYNPSYGIIGYKNESLEFTEYTRYILLNAIDLKYFEKNKKIKEYWNTAIISVGSSGDLRYVFPYLIAGSMKYIGTNTGKIITGYIYEDDSYIDIIKGNIPEPVSGIDF